jgi:acyl-CoA thioesterase
MDTILQQITEQVGREPFAQMMDMRLVHIDKGHAIVEMEFKREMENIFGMAHGGAIFALVDEAFEIASNSHGTMAVALNMNITYTAMAPPETRLRAEAKEVSITRRTASYSISVTDEADNLIATCQALVYRKGTPLPFLETEEEAS